MTVKIAAKEFAGWTILDHEDKPERTWTADELGGLTSSGGHSISGVRLARIADLTETGWQNVADLMEPFCEPGHADGFQWLSNEGKISLLLSVNGQW